MLHTVVGGRSVNTGNSLTAWFTSAAMMVAVLFAIWAFLRSRVGELVLGKDGRLSLWRLQIAVWTVTVGAVVYGHGLVQLNVPSIPESIVALLGLSLLTGGISYLGTDQKAQPPHAPAPGSAGAALLPAPPQPPAPVLAVPAEPGLWRLADLVSDEGVPSNARAQMLPWTVLMVVLFVLKSVLNGVIWEAPWAMIALMGISQGSYLAPKFVLPK